MFQVLFCGAPHARGMLGSAAEAVQAQTVANFYLAFELGVEVVPVINKIDLPAADPPRVAAEMQAAFDLPADKAILCSAKAGRGIADILDAIVDTVPPPAGDREAPCRLLLFDAHADEFRGIVCMVLVKDGAVRKGDKLRSCATGDALHVLEVLAPLPRISTRSASGCFWNCGPALTEWHAVQLGIMTPDMQPTGALLTGQVGYIITGLKSIKAARVGDTWHDHRAEPQPLPGFEAAKPMMYAGVLPACWLAWRMQLPLPPDHS